MSDSMGLDALRACALLFLAGPVLILAVKALRRRPRPAPSTRGGPRLWVRYFTLIGITVGLLLPAWLGELPFFAVVTVLTWLGLGELWGVLEAAGLRPLRLVGSVAGVGVVGAAQLLGAAALGPALALALLIVLGVVTLPGKRAGGPARAAATSLGLGVALLFSFLVLLRREPAGFGAVTFLWGVMQLNDTFSMLGGLAFGRRPFAPVLSPAKTWEGVVAGLLATAGGVVIFRFAVPTLRPVVVHGVAALLAIVGTAGGLCASALKRAADRKDFGTVFPGHGGVLDRFDSTLFAAPLLWLLLIVSR